MAQITLNSSGVASNGTLALQSNGTTTAVTIDASQNVGIGVTPSAWGSSYKVLQLNSQASLSATSISVELSNNIYYDGAYKFIGTGYANRYYQSVGEHVWNVSTASGTAGGAVTETNVMRLTSAGDLGIGTSSPTARLHVQSTGGTIFNLKDNTASGGGYANIFFSSDTVNANGFLGYNNSTNAMNFGTNNTERARIDSSGNFLVNTTTSSHSGVSSKCILKSSDNVLGLVTDSGNTQAARFTNGTTAVGSINLTTSTTAYGTSSDYRLKNTIAPMTGALAKVAQLKPVTYKWNVDGSDGEGFIAHELAEVCPDAVNGEKDAIHEDGSIKAQSIDTSFMVATLTAAIQELNAKFEAYKASHP
jgi:hypothetical protein